jgi:hypothetical protein
MDVGGEASSSLARLLSVAARSHALRPQAGFACSPWTLERVLRLDKHLFAARPILRTLDDTVGGYLFCDKGRSSFPVECASPGPRRETGRRPADNSGLPMSEAASNIGAEKPRICWMSAELAPRRQRLRQ